MSDFLENPRDARDAVLILRQMADPGFSSAITRPIYASRDRMARALSAMREWGVVPDDGGTGNLCWPSDLLAPLEASAILARLSASAHSTLDVHVLPVVDSTSAWVLSEGPASGNVACFAEYQWAGRGRRGRQWLMPFASGIALSLRWDVSRWSIIAPRITLAVGMAVAGRLRNLGLSDIGLKWPNDLQVSGHKLGGILVEQRRFAGGPCLVVGLGVNIRLPASLYLDQPVMDLESALGKRFCGRAEIAAALLESIAEALSRFPDQEPACLPDDWAAFDVLAGRTVCVQGPQGSVVGVGRGVDQSGRLCVESAAHLWRFDSGDVSVRAAAT